MSQLPDSPPPAALGWQPLTSAQRGVYFSHFSSADGAALTTAEVVEFSAAVDADRLQAAIDQTYREHEFLRTCFRDTADGPQQCVVDEPYAELEAFDLREGDAEAWIEQAIATPLDLHVGEVARTALLRVSDDTWWWFHAAHHVVLDGFGFIQFARRVAERYRGEPRDVEVATLANVVAEDLVASTDVETWRDRLRTLAATTNGDGATAGPAPRPLRAVRELTPGQQDAIKSAARELGVGWTELLTAALATCLARHEPTLRSTRVGVPIMNRVDVEHGARATARTVCTAVNVLPVGVVLGDRTVRDVVLDIRDQLADLARGHHPREEDLARELRSLGGGRLYEAQINVLPLDPVLDFGNGRGRIRNIVAGPVADMTWCVRGMPGRGRKVMLEVDANPRLHDHELLELQVDRALAWCEVFVASADAVVADLPILAAAEREQVVKAFNETAHDVRGRTLAEAFCAQAAATPEAVALLDGSTAWTYRELEQRARQLAAAMPDETSAIGIALPRGLDLFAAIYAAILRGMAYVPIDVDLPPRRIADMIADAEIGAIVCHSNFTDRLPPETTLITATYDREPWAGEVPRDLDAAAYILFTSGSTGRPKGVEVSHRAINNRLAWMQNELRLVPGEVVLHKTPISFDVSVWELFWPLQVGGVVAVAEPGGHRDPRYLGQLIASAGATTLHFVPSMLRAFLADRVAVASVPKGQLRHIVCSGEALAPDLVAVCHDVFDVAPVNLYGPTEAAVDVTVWQCDASRDIDVVPIGHPIWNTRTYVLDDRDEPVPIGVAGQLHLAGVQLATGYVGRPDLTAAAFVPDPFVPGERMYRTGDRARWQPDGSLVYLGRMDGQVKVRGQRLELGEVDHALQQLDGVETVATLALPDARGDLRLVAFHVADGVETPTLHTAAQEYLPAYMIPQVFVPIEAMPLSSSGKIDRLALAEVALADLVLDDAERSAVTPSGLLEQQICQTMSEVLGTLCGPADDFFFVGGHSLLALKVVTRLADELGVDVRFADLFAHPTPAGLAARISRLRSGADAAGNELGQLLTLRSGADDAVPLFALPPAGGLGWCYTGLLRHLPPDLPLHVLQGEGLDGSVAELPSSLTEMAERQLGLIRGVVGDGPFHLVGWSIGGMAAHSVAALAQKVGQRVGTVTMLDAYPSDQWQHLEPPDESEAMRAIVRMAGVEHRVKPEAVLDRESALDVLRGEGSALASLPGEVIAASVRTVINGAALVRTSEHERFDGDVLFVAAGAARAEDWLDAAGWAPYVGGDLRVEVLEATHPDLVREPHLATIGALMAAEISTWN